MIRSPLPGVWTLVDDDTVPQVQVDAQKDETVPPCVSDDTKPKDALVGTVPKAPFEVAAGSDNDLPQDAISTEEGVPEADETPV